MPGAHWYPLFPTVVLFASTASQETFVIAQSLFSSPTTKLIDGTCCTCLEDLSRIMRSHVIEALQERSLHGPYAIRQILKGGHPNNKKRFRLRQAPKYIKGIYNGQYFRVKLPQKSGGFPLIPSFPTILPVPQSVHGMLSESRKLSLEALFPLAGPEESFRRRFLTWCAINWPTLLLNVGSVCTLLAFTRSDVLELRSLSAMGSICNAIYRYSQKPVLWITVAWPSLFASVNGFKIMDIVHERNAEVHMDENQERIYVEYFLAHGITPKVRVPP